MRVGFEALLQKQGVYLFIQLSNLMWSRDLIVQPGIHLNK